MRRLGLCDVVLGVGVEGERGGLRVGYVYLRYLVMRSGWGYGTRMNCDF